jgi:hypothetical protein
LFKSFMPRGLRKLSFGQKIGVQISKICRHCNFSIPNNKTCTMETRWESKQFVESFKEETHSAFTKVFQDPSYEKRGMKYAINVDPLLCGDWGGDLYTMTCQSVCLGIPSFQLEIPKTVRTRLA